MTIPIHMIKLKNPDEGDFFKKGGILFKYKNKKWVPVEFSNPFKPRKCYE